MVYVNLVFTIIFPFCMHFSPPPRPAWCTHQFCSVHLALRLTAQDPFFNLNIFTLRQYIFSFVINFSIAGAMGATF